jgi:copper oxidase (laccase) domain-containing protein
LRWRLAHGVEVAYSPAAAGDQRDPDRRAEFIANLSAEAASRRLVVPRQIHGIEVVTLGGADLPPDQLAQADGAVTDQAGVALGAYGADCPGVVLAAPDAFGIAHCGWRGTAGGMVARLVAALAAISTAPRSSWQALIGPGISGARYEVDEPVLSARSWPAAALLPARPARAGLDLATALAHDLHAAGLGAVVSSGICTAGDPRLHSFRRHGPGLVQLLVAWRS